MNALLPSWRLIAAPIFLRGHGYGCRHPSIILRLTGPALEAETRRALGQIVTDQLSLTDAPESGDGASWHDTLDWLLRLITHIQQSCDLPLCDAAKTLHVAAPEAQIQIPSFIRSLSPVSRLFTALLALARPAHADAMPPALLQEIAAAYKDLTATAANGSNVPRFMRAAYGLGMPVKEMPGLYLRYGVGRRGFWMNSSFTQNTSHMAAQIVQNKAICAANLRLAGIAVPAHQLVQNPQQAVQVAQALDYPVVVKPADRDGGHGVAAGLETPEQVMAAFDVAKGLSPQILVEKHVEGRDYRLTVHRGEMIWAIERVPAGITGNGQDTVLQLVAKANADPRRSSSAHSPLKPIKLDAEAEHLLAKHGLTQNSIVPNGRTIRLRRAANVNSGGMPVAVFDQVHPDNARLAIAAAQVLRLDLAGIDLLIPDIARSWKETGGAICEVNGQPQIGGTTAMHLYPQILRKEVQGNGRVPTLLLWGELAADHPLRALEAHLSAHGLVVGWHDAKAVRIGGDIIAGGGIAPFAAGEMMASRPDVDIMVLTINDARALETGLAIPRVDMIVDAHAPAAIFPASPEPDMVKMMQMIAPASDGPIILSSEEAAHSWSEHTGVIPSYPVQLPQITEHLLQRHRSHGQDLA